MSRARGALLALVPVVLLAATAGPAAAARTTIGSDLAAPALLARSQANDVAFWPAAAGPTAPGGVDVPVAGQAITLRLKGGTVQPDGGATDPDYDVMHFQVLRPTGGDWKVVVTSEDFRAPVIGVGGVDQDTVTDYTSAFLCVQPGDRIALSTVGGFDAQKFPNGLPYQTFARTPTASTFEYGAGGTAGLGNDTTLPGARIQRDDGIELLLQVVIGSKSQARPSCGGTATRPDPGAGPDTSDGPSGGGSAGGGTGGGGSGSTPLRPKTTASLKGRRLGKDGKVPVALSCRAEGTTCKGRITLRARKRSIGSAAYALAPGKRKTFRVRLTKRGRSVLRAADGALRTALTLTTRGGIAKGGIFKLRPRA